MKKFIVFLCILVMCPGHVWAYSSEVIVGGATIGIDIESDGVMVIGFYKINGKYHKSSLVEGDIITKVEEEEIATAGKRIHEFTGGDFSKTYELLCKCFDGKGCKGCPAVYSFVCKKSLMEEFKGLLDQNHTKQSGVIVYHIKNEDGMHCFPKKCANCGKSLGDHIVPDYCPHCGARLTDKDNMAIVVRWYD